MFRVTLAMSSRLKQLADGENVYCTPDIYAAELVPFRAHISEQALPKYQTHTLIKRSNQSSTSLSQASAKTSGSNQPRRPAKSNNCYLKG